MSLPRRRVRFNYVVITVVGYWARRSGTGQQWTSVKMQISSAETNVKTQSLISHIID